MFRRDVLRELKKIKLAWPELNYFDGSGPLDPVSFDTGYRAAQSVDPYLISDLPHAIQLIVRKVR